MNKNPLELILNIFNKLNMQQRLLIGGVTVAALVLIVITFFFLNDPAYAVLYTNISQEDASKVIEHLNANKIPYRIENEGSTISISKDKLYETRLNLAGKGIPTSGIVGYEIFDNQTIGMSEFMQKLNYKRALEGELARTILQQEGIEGVRVHIVMPQKSIFKEEEKLPTASVVLKLKGIYKLPKNNINAITNLVAGSVEGLIPSKITLLDTQGRLLSRENDEDQFAAVSSKQYEIKQNVENYLAAKAQGMLDNILGYGNAIIQVNAELNFDKVEKTMELYDPESQVTISEQSVRSANNGRNLGDSTAQINENSTTNYEVSKTIEKVIAETGNIKKLSVAAVINDIMKEVKDGENINYVYEPRKPEQMKKLEELLKNSVGINPDRMDQFSIVNISFETNNQNNTDLEEPSMFDNYNDWGNIVLVLAAIISSFFLLKGLMSKLKNEKIIIGQYSPEPVYEKYSVPKTAGISDPLQIAPKPKRNFLPLGDIEDEISEEAAIKKNQHDKIVNYVSKNPIDAAKLINAWLHEDEL